MSHLSSLFKGFSSLPLGRVLPSFLEESRNCSQSSLVSNSRPALRFLYGPLAFSFFHSPFLDFVGKGSSLYYL